MRFASLFQFLADKQSDRGLMHSPRSVGIADLEKDFDRNSDAFIDAARFLERCLPLSFGI